MVFLLSPSESRRGVRLLATIVAGGISPVRATDAPLFTQPHFSFFEWVQWLFSKVPLLFQWRQKWQWKLAVIIPLLSFYYPLSAWVSTRQGGSPGGILSRLPETWDQPWMVRYLQSSQAGHKGKSYVLWFVPAVRSRMTEHGYSTYLSWLTGVDRAAPSNFV